MSTSQLLCRRSAPLSTSWMLSMRGCQSSVPCSMVISAHSHKVSPQSLFLFQRFQRSPVHSLAQCPVFRTILTRVHSLLPSMEWLCILFQRPHRSPVHSLVLHRVFHVSVGFASLIAPALDAHCIGGVSVSAPLWIVQQMQTQKVWLVLVVRIALTPSAVQSVEVRSQLFECVESHLVLRGFTQSAVLVAAPLHCTSSRCAFHGHPKRGGDGNPVSIGPVTPLHAARGDFQCTPTLVAK